MARVVLVGLPGVGKSTVGRALAERWGVDFVDCDEAFVDQWGESVQDVLRRDGESVFREREVHVLDQVLRTDAVVATGGGVVTTPQARSLLRAAPTLWLDAPDAVLVERVRDGDRPLLGDDPLEALARLRSQRSRFYADVARGHIVVDRDIDAICDDLERALEE